MHFPLFTPGPDTAVKSLVRTLDTLQAQLEHSEARRMDAEAAAAAGAANVAALKSELLQALSRMAALDDGEQAAQVGGLNAHRRRERPLSTFLLCLFSVRSLPSLWTCSHRRRSTHGWWSRRSMRSS